MDSEEEKTAQQIIAENCEASVNREFPSEWLNSTLDEITKAAKKGDKTARKAKKLLTDPRFRKK